MRRLIAVAVILFGLVLASGIGAAVWHWKGPAFVRQELERATGHRVSVGSVSLTPRMEVVVRDIAIAGSPPFEGQTVARIDRALVRLRGPKGFWSASQMWIDGLDVDYLSSSAGDNWHAAPAGPVKGPGRVGKPDDRPRAEARQALPPIQVVRARLRGTVALPHGPYLRFRTVGTRITRRSDGSVSAELGATTVDVDGWGTLRAETLSGERNARGATSLTGKQLSLQVPGGGTLLGGLALAASTATDGLAISLRSEASPSPSSEPSVLADAHVAARAIEVMVRANEVPLRALDPIARRSSIGLVHGHGSATVSLRLDRSSGRVDYIGRATVRGIDVLHPAVDTVPWRNQTASLDAQGYLDVGQRQAAVTQGTLTALAAELSVRATVEMADKPRGTLHLQTSKREGMPCAPLLLGQPEPVRAALAGLELDGRLGVSLSLGFDAATWEDVSLDVDVQPICAVRREPEALAALLPALLKSPAAGRNALPMSKVHPDFVPLAAMPRHLPSAFLTSEDSKFYRHQGFDLEMIRHALAQDLENRSFARVASTITQQLAKNLFLSHTRTLARKMEEAVFTWRLHKLLSKDRVLEVYLNVIELGPGIRGVKRAARYYFAKDVADLTPIESAHLAAMAPNPHALARRFRDGKVDEGWRQRLYDLLGMMKRHGRLSPEELAAARKTDLVLRDVGKLDGMAGPR